MKLVRKVVLGLFLTFLGLLFVFNIYQFVCIQIMDKSLATINGYAVLEVVSGSMEPTIHVGDLIVIDTKETEFKENDIITFTDDDGSFVTHRIISINNDKMVTKGDNNNSDDPSSSVTTIVGKYLFKLSGMGILFASLRNPFVMFMILVVGMLICYFLSLDSEGNLIMTEEEKEYQEFLEYQKSKEVLDDVPSTKSEKQDLKKKETSTTKKSKSLKQTKEPLKKVSTKRRVVKKDMSKKKTGKE